jgi:HTH-type transcriptional regulator/antitoxin HigA
VPTSKAARNKNKHRGSSFESFLKKDGLHEEVQVAALKRAVRVPRTEVEYQELVKFLDHLTDEVGEDENHPLASLMDVVGVLIEKYEDEHVATLEE